MTPTQADPASEADLARLSEAEAIANSDRVMSVYAAPEWAELNDESKAWIAAIVAETRARLRTPAPASEAMRVAREALEAENKELRAYLKAFCAATIDPEDRGRDVQQYEANPFIEYQFTCLCDDEPRPDRVLTGGQVRRAMELVGFDKLKIEPSDKTISQELTEARDLRREVKELREALARLDACPDDASGAVADETQIASLIALMGRETPPHNPDLLPGQQWTDPEWRRRILQCVPSAVEEACRRTARSIMALAAAPQPAPDARVGGERRALVWREMLNALRAAHAIVVTADDDLPRISERRRLVDGAITRAEEIERLDRLAAASPTPPSGDETGEA